ncbi:hypothetical protein MVEG_12369 [Podila verticillata NRRL 6337]|uniref:Heterokaryon incompatibility domain-containing protein n=1 Tax=Podila verticillata NRRL 6337 TaxID=1069443 RepID=A0A086TIK9_9FUNG|nr:hypothetical protein MVEG_12369 [Podila verticillata NRRL 6337]
MLSPPRRLFHIPSMTTVMYEDVADDVKDNGYVAISHVWGTLNMYAANELEIEDGVDWWLPLSDHSKITKVKNAMKYLKKEYCWFDALCMNQDRQYEIDQEVAFMGDYYAGADYTLVIPTTDPIPSEGYEKWYSMMGDIIEKKREFTSLEKDWIMAQIESGKPMLDLSKEKWFTRVWTFQEGAMAKELVLITSTEVYVFMFEIAHRISYMDSMDSSYTEYLFGVSRFPLLHVFGNRMDFRMYGTDLVNTMIACAGRDCFKQQDRFYGALGMLGYKDFPVDYTIDMEDLNNAIVKHAYSKGDISWLAIGGGTGKGFIQPMYKRFQVVGQIWKEESPNVCGIKIEDDILYINTCSFAKISQCEKFVGDYNKGGGFVGWMCQTFRKWGINDMDIAHCFMSFSDVPDILVEMAMVYLDSYARDAKEGVIKDLHEKFGKEHVDEHLSGLLNIISETKNACYDLVIAKATVNETGDNIALLVCGDPNVGDEVVLTRMYDTYERTLGIVCDSDRRKGICLYKKVSSDESRYVSHKFLL